MKQLLLLILGLLLTAMPSQAQEYPKAILKGDYPDPSILRDGKDFYMTHSPFYYQPGFLIWHSTDLVNWEPVTRAIPEYSGSAMAPDLVKYDGRYYIYYPAKGTNWVTWADDIRGPWSKPVDLHVGGIDPGHVADAAGRRYLFTDKGNVVELSKDGLKTIGRQHHVYDGWQYPKNWETECMCLESPKLTFHNGWFYLTSAEGGTAGPATSHMAVVARARSIDGPWENSPYNPVVHTWSQNDNWWSKGHGTIVDDGHGQWWIVYHAYAAGYHTLGRSTLIEPIEWTSDGWYRTTTTAARLPEDAGVKARAMKLSDDFSGRELGLQWTFWKEYAPRTLTFTGHGVEVKAKGTTPADGRLLLTTAEDKNYIAQADIRLEGGATAGLLLYYSEKGWAGVTTDGRTFTIYINKEKSFTVPNKIGKSFTARIHNRGNHAVIEVSKDGKTWITLAGDIDVSTLNHNNYGGFYALRPALFTAGKGKALFSNFVYKNAVPQEKDMAAYLMVFHKDDTHSLHAALSRDGYSFTALNDGKPIIAGDTIAEQRGIRDPHIYRGPDGAFYLAMTDLHIYAQKAGYRTTEWERDGKKYGWGNNRDLILMKSWDLIHWQRSIIDFTKLSAEYREIGCAWAPETVYDEQTGKLMLYFTMRFGNEPNFLAWAYVNDDYTRLESKPQLLFAYPSEKVSAIDGDITRVGDTCHLFYVAHDGGAGIKQATSANVNGGWRYDARWYDPEPQACEAPTVWKRIGEQKWVLMYDCYGIKVHNFGFTETSDFVNFKPLGHFNEGVMKSTNFTSPKHGAVVHLTETEARRLAARWHLDYDSLPH